MVLEFINFKNRDIENVDNFCGITPCRIEIISIFAIENITISLSADK